MPTVSIRQSSRFLGIKAVRQWGQFDQTVFPGNEYQKGNSENDEPPFEEKSQNNDLVKGGETNAINAFFVNENQKSQLNSMFV